MQSLLFVDILSNTFVFLTLIVMLVASIGIISEQFSIILLNGFMAFIVLAMETGYSLYTQILTISLVIGIIATAFQLWGEMMGSNGGVE